MVKKLWCREIARKWLQKKSEVISARLLTEPKWQNHASTWYLILRWIILFGWTSILVCSIFEFGSYKPLGKNYLWLIYLTNWDIVLGSLQAFIGFYLVWKRHKFEKISGFDPNDLKLNFFERTYWFLYVVTCTTALGVTITYWYAVYNPKEHEIDPLNIMIHCCNSVLMLIDFCVSSVPLKFWHFWWCPLIIIFYFIFSLIYYAAGGVDKRGYQYIYKILDWSKPERSVLVCIGGLIFVIFLHLVLCILQKFRNRTCDKVQRISTPSTFDLESGCVSMKKLPENV